MTKPNPVTELARIAGSFGRAAAREKERLLREIERRQRFGVRDLAALHDVVCFLLAYPDEARVRRGVDELAGRLRELLAASGLDGDSDALADTGFPGSVCHYEFSLPVLARMSRRFPGCFEVDWDELEDQEPLVNTLGLLVTSGECQGLDDIHLDLSTWIRAAKPHPEATDLSFLLPLFESSSYDVTTRDHLWEMCAVPIRYRLDRGAARCEIRLRVGTRLHYQRKDFARELQPLAATIRRPLRDVQRLNHREGDVVIDAALASLCARSLEIRTLSYANARDVWLAAGDRGLQIALIGVVPGYRDPLECHYLALVIKNGVPIAYGPATVSLGCCEMGLNLFPEYRGAEVRFVYPQFMRAIHHVLGAQYFYLTSYGMGEDNPAAIRTGAFWFYRKLGFRPTNPAVEALAQEEEARMRADPSHRSSRRMLHRLSHTEAFFDVSNGACRPLDAGAIGLRQSRFLTHEFGMDRARAERQCIQRAARLLGAPSVKREPDAARRAWSMLGPIVCLIPDLDRWSARDKGRLLRIVRAKGKPSEAGVDRMILAHAPFMDALQGLARSVSSSRTSPGPSG